MRVVGHLKRGSFAFDSPPPGLELFDRELCDLEQTLDLFDGQTLVIHVAAVTDARTSDEKSLQQQVNVEATRNVVAACRRHSVPRLVHISSTAAIGIPPGPTTPADETFRFNLDHLDLSYNRTKHEAEQLVLRANASGLETLVVNPGFMFGSHKGGYRGAAVIDRVLRRRVVLCTNGGLSVVHVDDVTEGIRRVADRGRAGERYILSGENLTFRNMAHAICGVSGQRSIIVPVPNIARDLAGAVLNSRLARANVHGFRTHLSQDYAYQFYSSEKATRELGYRPRSFASIVADRLDHERRASVNPAS